MALSLIRTGEPAAKPAPTLTATSSRTISGKDWRREFLESRRVEVGRNRGLEFAPHSEPMGYCHFGQATQRLTIVKCILQEGDVVASYLK